MCSCSVAEFVKVAREQVERLHQFPYLLFTTVYLLRFLHLTPWDLLYFMYSTSLHSPLTPLDTIPLTALTCRIRPE